MRGKCAPVSFARQVGATPSAAASLPALPLILCLATQILPHLGCAKLPPHCLSSQCTLFSTFQNVIWVVIYMTVFSSRP